MTKDTLTLTNDQVVAAADGIIVLQRLYMIRAGEPGHDGAAQKAMDIASAASALAAQAGVVRRAREILLVQYGRPQANQQGQQGHVLDPDQADKYNAALDAIMGATVKMTFAPITITTLDIASMSNQPGALGAIRPIVVLADE